jgi:hypothetical protein
LNSFLLPDLFEPLANEPDFDPYTSSLGAAEVPRTLSAAEAQQPDRGPEPRQFEDPAEIDYQAQIDELSAQLANLQASAGLNDCSLAGERLPRAGQRFVAGGVKGVAVALPGGAEVLRSINVGYAIDR